MSWESEMHQDEMQEWKDFGVYCEKHDMWFLPTRGGMCCDCEDGLPPIKKERYTDQELINLGKLEKTKDGHLRTPT